MCMCACTMSCKNTDYACPCIFCIPSRCPSVALISTTSLRYFMSICVYVFCVHAYVCVCVLCNELLAYVRVCVSVLCNEMLVE